MKYLLDTNVLSELRKGPRANLHVAAWFASVPDQAIYLSVLVIGEIRRGIERIRSRDPRAAITLEDWLTQVITGHRGRILTVDHTVAEEWGRLTASRLWVPKTRRNHQPAGWRLCDHVARRS